MLDYSHNINLINKSFLIKKTNVESFFNIFSFFIDLIANFFLFDIFEI